MNYINFEDKIQQNSNNIYNLDPKQLKDIFEGGDFAVNIKPVPSTPFNQSDNN